MSTCTSLFFFNDTATTEIYTLSLHDALPIFRPRYGRGYWSTTHRSYVSKPRVYVSIEGEGIWENFANRTSRPSKDRKSTRLNSSHANISYAVFCLKKKKKNTVC